MPKGCCFGYSQGTPCCCIGEDEVSSKQAQLDMSFNVGDWVYLRLQPYKQNTLAYKGKWKLSPRFFRPFQIL